MTVGQMRFGTGNDAGADGTGLVSGNSRTTLYAENSGDPGLETPAYAVAARGRGIAIRGHGVEAGVTGSSPKLGVAGEGFCGVGGLTEHDDQAAAAVYGAALKGNANGVVGEADDGPNAFAVWGKSESGYAGYFSGRVNVTENLTVAAGGFRIDHPLDPQQRYLRHSFVHSPEWLNVYSGRVVTDAEGSAVVELPGYFEALNKDIRYQLTVIGGFAQAVVAEEVRDNRFTVATDRPGVTVCWQVTGVRQDPYSLSEGPRAPETDKPEGEGNTFLHPHEHGFPPEAGRDHWRVEAFREQRFRLRVGRPPEPPA
ncbi:hypothetical protein [Streptomyces litchfieldiae]|uniref:Uncharacterized protein n=1 Tax=Streptomyces litchfieldiae TaxID=3075543 RepID=A0ABU2MS89_9ACTN|nr:hypothetical protein [Streptomyces sp. DSM 44938]MDT0344508.1 hypothetical protein [Streptomyces sp. DSM 44938]